MAKQESRDAREKARVERRQRFELIFGTVFASLLISALLTLDLLPASTVGLGGVPRSGNISDRDYKAPADITLVDQEATEVLRREATESAPVVYDFDEGRLEALGERLAASFAAARAVEIEEGADAAEAQITSFREALGGEIELPESALAYLQQSGFLPDDEGLLLSVATPVARMIVDDPEQFDLHVEKRIVLRRELGSGNETRLSEPDSVLTSEEARKLVDARAAEVLSGESARRRKALLGLVRALIRPNLDFNLRATDERRQAAEADVAEATISLRKGEIIVRDGDPFSERHVQILEGIREQQRTLSRVEMLIGVAGVLVVLMLTIWRFGTRGLARFPSQRKDAWFLLTATLFTAVGTGVALFLCDAVAQNPFFAPIVEDTPSLLYWVIPISAATMLVRVVHTAETAALFAVMVSLLMGLQVPGGVIFALYTLVGSLIAAIGVARVSQRGTLLLAGMRVGAANVVMIFALSLLEGRLDPLGVSISMGLGLLSGGLAGVLVTGLAPIVESVFSYTTDVKLLELANREQPLLRELELRAPGTYHHSMMVGHLAEKAAEAIGANALLAKVAGYYHDIGKMRRPHFFVENYTVHGDENRHEKLSPSMSARIIQAHVKDGIEMGEKSGLAEPIMRGIREHHGTSVIRFFYEKAKELADPEKGELVAEHDYRYAGPRPQTREAGILMLADSVEAASRTLPETSPSRVQQLVQRLINNYFRDGQLDECSLTLRDLHAIARSFIDTLSAIRHERIDYPEATDAEGRRVDEGMDEGVVERLEPRTADRSEGTPEEREDDIKRLGLP